jgi:hypothetical protein
MSKKAKLIKRLLLKPKDFSFQEAVTLLESFGCQKSNKGKTSGSRVEFVKNKISITLHKPHPRKELAEYQIKQVLDRLKKENLI